jgi:hypothetical protein
MAEKNSDIQLDNDIAIWHMREEGLIRGTYAGTFKFRCFLTPTMKIAANREYREMLGPNPSMAGEHESELAWALSQLRQRVLEAPPFWQAGKMAGDIEDANIIQTVLDAAIRAELKYVENLKERKEQQVKLAREAAEKFLKEQAENAEVDEDEGDEG